MDAIKVKDANFCRFYRDDQYGLVILVSKATGDKSAMFVDRDRTTRYFGEHHMLNTMPAECDSFDWEPEGQKAKINTGEGWRLLSPDEKVVRGDQYWSTAYSAWLCSVNGIGVGRQSIHTYRRRSEGHFVEQQTNSGFKPGDRVKVIRKARANEMGWGGQWADDMDGIVGETVEIISNDGLHGFRFRNQRTTRHIPYFVLEKVEPGFRAFANGDEFRPHRDRWFVLKDQRDGAAARAYNYSHFGIDLSPSNFIDWNDLFVKREFEDGSPFGVLIANEGE